MGRNKLGTNLNDESATSQVSRVVLSAFDEKTKSCENEIESCLASARDNISALLSEMRNQKQI